MVLLEGGECSDLLPLISQRHSPERSRCLPLFPPQMWKTRRAEKGLCVCVCVCEVTWIMLLPAHWRTQLKLNNGNKTWFWHPTVVRNTSLFFSFSFFFLPHLFFLFISLHLSFSHFTPTSLSLPLSLLLSNLLNSIQFSILIQFNPTQSESIWFTLIQMCFIAITKMLNAWPTLHWRELH